MRKKMKFRANKLFLGAFFLISAVFLVFAELRICPSCSYEIPENAEKCEHCGTLAPRIDDKAAEKPTVAQDRSQPLDIERVKTEIKFGQEQFSKGDPDVARLFFKNASVLNLIANSGTNALKADTFAELFKKCEIGASTVLVKCPVCNGTGKRMMKVSSLISDKEESVEADGLACQNCGGGGQIPRRGTIDERKFSIGRAAARFTAFQQGRKYESLGGAWLPQGIADKLNVKQTATIRKASAASCQTCMGLGRADCTKCGATGLVKCTARCDNGTVTVEVTGSLVKANMKRTEKCKTCSGSGKIACETCGGKGMVLCKDCNGSGERPECKKCGGQGFEQCAKCKGSGKGKEDTCAACGGDGNILCSSCKGDGRK